MDTDGLGASLNERGAEEEAKLSGGIDGFKSGYDCMIWGSEDEWE